MHPVNPATGAVYIELQTLSVVFSIFCCRIGSFLALGTGKVNYPSGISFLGHYLLNDTAEGAGPYRSTSLTNREA